ncbi:hypothetical protein [Sphingobium cloacae]|uniref:Uncharacterized protein n=1 Tax=Sphingobium cloacae TaxID=120107 RepID=A0A1E1F4J4_9SPHN|nr:hypothetical protein [Sphingobium cloacae]BAV65444.1 hypothetical protein SCLO_1024040 [Sphingobium cloacae]
MSQSRRKWVRILFAGPGAVLAALVIMAGMPLWLPRGAAGIDNLVLPLVLAPLIWAALFFHACLDRRLGRVVAVAIALIVLHGGLVAYGFAHPSPSPRESRR